MAAKKLAKPTGRERQTARGSAGEEASWKPRIIVRFREDVSIPYNVTDVGQHLDKLRVGPWSQLLKVHSQLTIKSLFSSVSVDRLGELVRLASRRDPAYRPPNFLSFCLVEFPIELQARAIVNQFDGWGSVRSVYVDPPGSEPFVPGNDPNWPSQGYLDAAPDGIDAEFTWPLAGGDGTGQDLVHLERGWTLKHEDLAGHGIGAPLYGDIRDLSRSHGTAALGEICALGNGVGCIGIAPNVGSVNVVSYHGAGKTRPDAVMAAIDALPYGGVLFIGAQIDVLMIGAKEWYAVPIEVVEAEFEVIRLATALGITVVEAAGNGGNDLDTFADANGRLVLNRTSADFRDSGAIMVAAATAAAPHAPATAPPPAPPFIYTNFGSRIDCYAWGENVVTTDSPNSPPFDTNTYTPNFSGTSAAAPIIAGAALVVQGLAEAGLGYRFDAWQTRALLSDPATGTPSKDPANDGIGVMPNLAAIVNTPALNVGSDVYVRDFIGDLGEPHTDVISVSPDVILLPAVEPSPQLTFGEGSGTENSVTLGSQAEAGQDNYIYVRVRNRGGSDAAHVTAAVYWSPPATLVTPDLWHPIGQTVIANVPSGRVLTVSDAIVWSSIDIPATGHYCFIALVGHAADPAPAPADLMDWTNFERFIRSSNNVTWHNFNVVDNQPMQGSDPANFVALDFMAPGAPDQARYMRLDVIAGLPEGSRVLLEIPQLMYGGMRGPHAIEMHRRRRSALIPMNPYGRRSLGEILLPVRSRSKLRLLVHIPERRRDMPYEIAVQQLFENRPVGRLTWRLAPRQKRVTRKDRGAR